MNVAVRKELYFCDHCGEQIDMGMNYGWLIMKSYSGGEELELNFCPKCFRVVKNDYVQKRNEISIDRDSITML